MQISKKESLEREICDAIIRFESATGEAVYRIDMFRDLDSGQLASPVYKVDVELYPQEQYDGPYLHKHNGDDFPDHINEKLYDVLYGTNEPSEGLREAQRIHEQLIIKDE